MPPGKSPGLFVLNVNVYLESTCQPFGNSPAFVILLRQNKSPNKTICTCGSHPPRWPPSLPLGIHTLIWFPSTLCQLVCVTNGRWQKSYLSLPRLGYKSHSGFYLGGSLCFSLGSFVLGEASCHVRSNCTERLREGRAEGSWLKEILQPSQA